MYKDKSFLAIIPARGGSKRLLNKNVLPVCGKPLISWTIDAAIQSKYVDNVVVSSDDPVALDIANGLNVVALKRPEALASDLATSIDVLIHAIENVSGNFDYVILLQPTSPLRTAEHIDGAIEQLISNPVADSVISVAEMNHSPQWANILPENASMKGFILNNADLKRSQDLEKYYRLNGAIYIKDTIRAKQEGKLLSENSYAYIMSAEDSIDIDTKYDLICAEAILNYKLKKIEIEEPLT